MSFREFNSIEMKESVSNYTNLEEKTSCEISDNVEQVRKIDCEKATIIVGRSLLFVFTLCYYVFSIKSLFDISYVEERKRCKISDLWCYLFSSLFGNLIFIKIVTRLNENKLCIILSPNMYILGIKSSYILWGSLLFYGIPCLDKLSSSLLFKMALFQYIFDIISLALTFIISVHPVHFLCGKSVRKNLNISFANSSFSFVSFVILKEFLAEQIPKFFTIFLL